MKFKSFLIVMCILGFNYFPVDLKAEEYELEIIPELKNKMTDLSKKYNCRPVFYPPHRRAFIKGYGAGDSEDSLVFWCQKLDSNELEIGPKELKKNYYLMIVYKGEEQDVGYCPRVLERYEYEYIELIKPNGFQVLSNKATSLKNFSYLKEPRKRGPELSPNHNGILLSDEGYNRILYCHKGNWLTYYWDYEFVE